MGSRSRDLNKSTRVYTSTHLDRPSLLIIIKSDLVFKLTVGRKSPRKRRWTKRQKRGEKRGQKEEKFDRAFVFIVVMTLSLGERYKVKVNRRPLVFEPLVISEIHSVCTKSPTLYTGLLRCKCSHTN